MLFDLARKRFSWHHEAPLHASSKHSTDALEREDARNGHAYQHDRGRESTLHTTHGRVHVELAVSTENSNSGLDENVTNAVSTWNSAVPTITGTSSAKADP